MNLIGSLVNNNTVKEASDGKASRYKCNWRRSFSPRYPHP
jgi:hypothetical protein